ncbi:hypothetical protein DIPPA_21357 [Diplonema papillatum]|nr:hypothetical protein DIPPA_21357 [Diplonema papillatum]
MVRKKARGGGGSAEEASGSDGGSSSVDEDAVKLHQYTDLIHRQQVVISELERSTTEGHLRPKRAAADLYLNPCLPEALRRHIRISAPPNILAPAAAAAPLLCKQPTECGSDCGSTALSNSVTRLKEIEGAAALYRNGILPLSLRKPRYPESIGSRSSSFASGSLPRPRLVDVRVFSAGRPSVTLEEIETMQDVIDGLFAVTGVPSRVTDYLSGGIRLGVGDALGLQPMGQDGVVELQYAPFTALPPWTAEPSRAGSSEASRSQHPSPAASASPDAAFSPPHKAAPPADVPWPGWRPPGGASPLPRPAFADNAMLPSHTRRQTPDRTPVPVTPKPPSLGRSGVVPYMPTRSSSLVGITMSTPSLVNLVHEDMPKRKSAPVAEGPAPVSVLSPLMQPVPVITTATHLPLGVSARSAQANGRSEHFRKHATPVLLPASPPLPTSASNSNASDAGACDDASSAAPPLAKTPPGPHPCSGSVSPNSAAVEKSPSGSSGLLSGPTQHRVFPPSSAGEDALEKKWNSAESSTSAEYVVPACISCPNPTPASKVPYMRGWASGDYKPFLRKWPCDLIAVAKPLGAPHVCVCATKGDSRFAVYDLAASAQSEPNWIVLRMKIQCLSAAGDNVVVGGQNRLVCWNLSKGMFEWDAVTTQYAVVAAGGCDGLVIGEAEGSLSLGRIVPGPNERVDVTLRRSVPLEGAWLKVVIDGEYVAGLDGSHTLFVWRGLGCKRAGELIGFRKGPSFSKTPMGFPPGVFTDLSVCTGVIATRHEAEDRGHDPRCSVQLWDIDTGYYSVSWSNPSLAALAMAGDDPADGIIAIADSAGLRIFGHAREGNRPGADHERSVSELRSWPTPDKVVSPRSVVYDFLFFAPCDSLQ